MHRPPCFDPHAPTPVRKGSGRKTRISHARSRRSLVGAACPSPAPASRRCLMGAARRRGPTIIEQAQPRGRCLPLPRAGQQALPAGSQQTQPRGRCLPPSPPVSKRCLMGAACHRVPAGAASWALPAPHPHRSADAASWALPATGARPSWSRRSLVSAASPTSRGRRCLVGAASPSRMPPNRLTARTACAKKRCGPGPRSWPQWFSLARGVQKTHVTWLVCTPRASDKDAE